MITARDGQVYAAKIESILCVATDRWDEAAEQVASLNADELDLFSSQLDGLKALVDATRKKGNHR